MLNKKMVSLINKENKIPEISITYNPKITAKPTIICSIDAYVLFLDFFPKNTIQLQERLVAMYLNHAHQVLGIYVVSVGGLTCTIADIRLILSVALKTAATGIMIAHNHPSGTLKPSSTDINLTTRIKEAGKLMDILLIDHIIVTPVDKQYFSFSDEGLL